MTRDKLKLTMTHSARRSGKTHILVDNAINYLIKNKKRRVTIVTPHPVLTIDIITCNLNVEEVLKKNSNFVEFKNNDVIYIIEVFNFEDAAKPRRLFSEKVFMDEFQLEFQLEVHKNEKANKLFKNFSENGVKEIECRFTSMLQNFKKTLFDLVIYYIKSNRTYCEFEKNLRHHFSKEDLEYHWRILSKSVYINQNVDITIEEDYVNTIDTKINLVSCYADLFSLEQYIFHHTIARDLYGMFFENKPLYKAVNVITFEKLNRVKKMLNETNRLVESEKND